MITMILKEDAVALSKESGFLDVFDSAPTQVCIALQTGKNRRVFYGQKNYPDPKKNFIVVIDCDDDRELDQIYQMFKQRMPDLILSDGQHELFHHQR